MEAFAAPVVEKKKEREAEAEVHAEQEEFQQGQLMHVFRSEDGTIELVEPDPPECLFCTKVIELESTRYPNCGHVCHLQCLVRTVFLGNRQQQFLNGTCPACKLDEGVDGKFRRFRAFMQEAKKNVEEWAKMSKQKELAFFRFIGLWDTPQTALILQREIGGENEVLTRFMVMSAKSAASSSSQKGNGIFGWSWNKSDEPTADDVAKVIDLKSKLVPSDYPKTHFPLKKLVNERGGVSLPWICDTFNVKTIDDLVEHLGFGATCLKFFSVPECLAVRFLENVSGTELAQKTLMTISDLYELDSKELNILGLDVRIMILLGLKKDHIKHFSFMGMVNWVEDLGFDTDIIRCMGVAITEIQSKFFGDSWDAKTLVKILNITTEMAQKMDWN